MSQYQHAVRCSTAKCAGARDGKHAAHLAFGCIALDSASELQWSSPTCAGPHDTSARASALLAVPCCCVSAERSADLCDSCTSFRAAQQACVFCCRCTATLGSHESSTTRTASSAWISRFRRCPAQQTGCVPPSRRARPRRDRRGLSAPQCSSSRQVLSGASRALLQLRPRCRRHQRRPRGCAPRAASDVLGCLCSVLSPGMCVVCTIQVRCLEALRTKPHVTRMP